MVDLRKFAEEDIKKHDNQYLMALWYDQNGMWDQAHKLVQNMSDKIAYRIHAYLHRKEGDISNSKYWYGQANLKYNDQITLNEEVACILMEINHKSQLAKV